MVGLATAKHLSQHVAKRPQDSELNLITAYNKWKKIRMALNILESPKGNQMGTLNTGQCPVIKDADF